MDDYLVEEWESTATALAPAEQRPEGEACLGHLGRILFVEDEPLIRDLARAVLTRNGYEVVAASDAAAALAALDEGCSVDLLVTDVVMPGIDGLELVRQVRDRCSDHVPVILMSGYSDALAENGAPPGRFLAKPFGPDTLLESVRDALCAKQQESA